MAMALVTAALDPFKLSFVEEAGLYPYTDFWAITDYITTVIFLIDMVLKFMLMFQDAEGGLVRDHKIIALNYLRFLFWVDLVTTLPLDGFVSIALGYRYRSDSAAGLYVALVRWVKLGRLYRIFDLFAMLEHKMVISQVSLILLRNNIYIAFITHWMACLFYYVARAELFSERSWVGRNSWRFDDQGVGVRYVYSLYFSVSAFAGLGDGDFYCASPAESIVMIIFLLGNIVFQAYILGTVTFVLVKADEKSKVYRERMEALRGYAGINDLPQPLMEMMKEHIELQYHNEQCSDEMVSVLSEGDVVSELYIIIDGTVCGCAGMGGASLNAMRRNSVLGLESSSQVAAEQAKSIVANRRRSMVMAANLPGAETADETTVFIDAIKKQLNKAQVARLEQLDQVRALVAGFLSKQESQKVFEFLQAAAASDMQALRSLMSQGVGPNATDYDDRTALMVASHKGLVAVATLLLDAAADPNRVDAFGNTALLEAVKGGHMEVMEVLLDAGAVLGLDDTAAASLLCKTVIDGDVAKLKQWLKAGVPVNVCDYDNRTPLHVAASEGNLYAGHTPLGDAVAAGHSSVVDFLAPLYEAQAAAKAMQLLATRAGQCLLPQTC
ncbi:uncharacterized protein HaLaN_12477, partial [Haematococcus lacustris]